MSRAAERGKKAQVALKRRPPDQVVERGSKIAVQAAPRNVREILRRPGGVRTALPASLCQVSREDDENA
jgi:hypothetical protein